MSVTVKTIRHDQEHDFIEYYVYDEKCYAVEVDSRLTVYRAVADNAVVGIQLRGVSELATRADIFSGI